MESSSALPNPDDAAAVLDDAERSRSELVGEIVLPSRHHAWIGAAVAVQIATAAVGVVVNAPWGFAVLAAGALVFVVVAGVQLQHFRKQNGVWLSGFASRNVFGSSISASIGYAAGLASALAAGYAGLWWLAGVCAIGGGLAYALAGRRWWRRYRHNPAGNAHGESALLLAILVLLAVVGAVLLVVLS